MWSVRTMNLTKVVSCVSKFFFQYRSRPPVVSSDVDGFKFNCVFTARNNARIASAVLATAIPSVCLSVFLSVKQSTFPLLLTLNILQAARTMRLSNLRMSILENGMHM